MAGHGYLAVGLLALLPSICLAAYVGLSRVFRQGMPRKEAALCWTAMVLSLSFPLTCGYVGRHKRWSTLVMEIEESLVDEFGRDWGFRLVQLHMSRSPPTFPRGAFRRRRVRSRRGDGCGAGFHVCAGGRSSVCVFSNDCGVPMTRRRGVSPLKGQCRLQKGLKRFCHPEGPEE
ncbi:unnamed protein product [Durusdinium trenchii]|uniref:Uncharacterized protein n=1 Tax=Durusdinium trenchii TaxID=1381693 RepID=A0ABP0PCM7_9DINO